MFRLDSISTFVYMYLHHIYRYACIHASQVWVRSCTLNKTLNSNPSILYCLLCCLFGRGAVRLVQVVNILRVVLRFTRSAVAFAMRPACCQHASKQRHATNSRTTPRRRHRTPMHNSLGFDAGFCCASAFHLVNFRQRHPPTRTNPFQASFPAFAPAKTHLTRREL